MTLKMLACAGAHVGTVADTPRAQPASLFLFFVLFSHQLREKTPKCRVARGARRVFGSVSAVPNSRRERFSISTDFPAPWILSEARLLRYDNRVNIRHSLRAKAFAATMTTG
jgi:hypothetical protein